MFVCGGGGFEDFVQSGPTFGIEEHRTLVGDFALLRRTLPFTVGKHILLHTSTLTHRSTTAVPLRHNMYSLLHAVISEKSLQFVFKE